MGYSSNVQRSDEIKNANDTSPTDSSLDTDFKMGNRRNKNSMSDGGITYPGQVVDMSTVQNSFCNNEVKMLPDLYVQQQHQQQQLLLQQHQQQHQLLQQHQQQQQQQQQQQLLQQMQLQAQNPVFLQMNPNAAPTAPIYPYMIPQAQPLQLTDPAHMNTGRIMHYPVNTINGPAAVSMQPLQSIPVAINMATLMPSMQHLHPQLPQPQPQQQMQPLSPFSYNFSLTEGQQIMSSPIMLQTPASMLTQPAINIPAQTQQKPDSLLLPVQTSSLTTATTATLPISSQPTPIQAPGPTIPLTIQDRPNIPPTFHPINLSYPNLHHISHLGSDVTTPSTFTSSSSTSTNNIPFPNDPPLYAIPNFLTSNECDFLIHHAQSEFTVAPVVGPGVGMISSSRTSSTCYLAREDLPLLMQKVCALTNKPVQHCELPQVGRYFPTQEYRQHFDAFDLSNADGLRFAANGGQRVLTVLIYLNTPTSGGHTRFPSIFTHKHTWEQQQRQFEQSSSNNSDRITNDLNLEQKIALTSSSLTTGTTEEIVPLEIKPQKGMAIVFHPSTVDGLLDKRALHAAMPAEDVKYVSQVWIRQSDYDGRPSVRLPQLLDESVNRITTQHANNGVAVSAVDLNENAIMKDVDSAMDDLNVPMESMRVDDVRNCYIDKE